MNYKVQLKLEGFAMKPKIGLSMLYCLNKPFNRIPAQIQEAKTAYIEIVDDGFHTLSNRRVRALKEIGNSYNLNYSIHAPFADINIASPSKPMLKAMITRLEKSMAYASALNASIWVFHPGLKTGVSMFYPGMDWLQNLKTTHLLLKKAEDYGIKIAIENVPEPYPFLMKSVEDFAKFYEEVNEEIGLAFDVAHANLNGQIESFLTVFKDKIVHAHLHDNDGKGDQHLGIGYGTIDWEKVAKLFEKISYNKILIVESVEHVKESMEKLRKLFP
ncbi:MAG: sugar phosphate isomerase/epimerase family protein [Candidatus Bathyarchaeota archaeon]|jgi:sugar phosphate isomerase/epimerase|nr:sugar phosphate isomerase/epimerase family protein [Candidatus Bathyarchaeota archaeon]